MTARLPTVVILAVLMVASTTCSSAGEGTARSVDGPPPPPTVVPEDETLEEIPPEVIDEITNEVLDAYNQPRSADADRYGPAGDYIDRNPPPFDMAQGEEILRALESGDAAGTADVFTAESAELAGELAGVFASMPEPHLEFLGGVLVVGDDQASGLVTLTTGGERQILNLAFVLVEERWLLESIR